MKNQVNYTKVAFIENFNPKRGYPEFAKKAEVIAKKEVVIKVKKVKAVNVELKAAKKGATWIGGNKKPTLLKAH